MKKEEEVKLVVKPECEPGWRGCAPECGSLQRSAMLRAVQRIPTVHQAQSSIVASCDGRRGDSSARLQAAHARLRPMPQTALAQRAAAARCPPTPPWRSTWHCWAGRRWRRSLVSGVCARPLLRMLWLPRAAVCAHAWFSPAAFALAPPASVGGLLPRAAARALTAAVWRRKRRASSTPIAQRACSCTRRWVCAQEQAWSGCTIALPVSACVRVPQRMVW